MVEAIQPRSVFVAAPDNALIHALAEQRPPKTGWRFMPLNGDTPQQDALVILDFEQKTERDRWIASLRDDGFSGPIVILGGEDAPQSPDDEPIARPARLQTLLARIDAHGAESGSGETLPLGPYDFVPGDRALLHRESNLVIRLTELERRLLSCLSENPDGIVPRDALLSRVWGYSSAVATHTVETHIWRLRQKIETDDPATRLVVTEAGGYRLARGGVDSNG